METQEFMNIQKQIPTFPLGVVLMPHMTMPLHIFEERYKAMVNECLERNEPFGIVYFDGKKIHKVGCTAHIIEILKQYDDGRMDILVRGDQRFYIDQMDDSRAYLISGIFYIDDPEESAGAEDEALVKNTVKLLNHIGDLSGISVADNRFDVMDLKELSFIVPGTDGFTMEERQQFLEMTSSRERLGKGLKVLEKVVQRVKINQEASQIIGGNGHVRALLKERGIKT